jgi:hypothetical protein
MLIFRSAKRRSCPNKQKDAILSDIVLLYYLLNLRILPNQVSKLAPMLGVLPVEAARVDGLLFFTLVNKLSLHHIAESEQEHFGH